MALPLYLAMTAAEIPANSALPKYLGYMACHFSPYGSGLCNFPDFLPPDSLLILNDRIPCCGHDNQLITNQLVELIEEFECDSVLLDFQRPGSEETAALVAILAQTLPCPVGVSEPYAQDVNCPVFLPPVPLDIRIPDYLAPWKGREIWLDIAAEGIALTLTENGSTGCPLPYPQLSGGFPDEPLHIHYHIEKIEDSVQFQLFRTQDDIHALLEEANQHGVTQAVGLWQELIDL